jgi:hypothetical protein
MGAIGWWEAVPQARRVEGHLHVVQAIGTFPVVFGADPVVISVSLLPDPVAILPD